jgi:predicted FMN-binding regulatory protein PaiB
MEIQQLQGKWKLGQNRTREDREGAVAGLRATGTHDATTLADWMEQTLKENKQA